MLYILANLELYDSYSIQEGKATYKMFHLNKMLLEDILRTVNIMSLKSRSTWCKLMSRFGIGRLCYKRNQCYINKLYH